IRSAERHLFVKSIYTGGTGIYQVFTVRMSGCFKNMRKSYYIAVDVCHRVFKAIAYAGLCSQMANLVKFFVFAQLHQTLPILQIHFYKTVIWVGMALSEFVLGYCYLSNPCIGQPGIF